MFTHMRVDPGMTDSGAQKWMSLSDCTGVCTDELSGSRTSNRSSLPIPSWRGELHGLTQGPSDRVLSTVLVMKKKVTRIMLAHSCVTEAFSKDSLNPNARTLNFQLLII